MRDAFLSTVTPDEMEQVTRNLLRIAKGNTKDAIAAADLILNRVFGKPKESVEVTATGSQLPAAQLDNLSDSERAQLLALAEKSLLPTRTAEVQPQ